MNLKFFTKGQQKIPLFKEGVVMLVDKPLEWTSFSVVNKLRYRLSRIEGVKRLKVGHAGTLDPLATGLLIICCGKYTKLLDQFQGLQKQYSGTITLGATRPSFDMETEIDKHYDTSGISELMVTEAAKKFVGVIDQIPPVYSAVKQDGERLYKKARRGEDVVIKSREITIDRFDIDTSNFPDIEFELDCSKGTYVRSLAKDLGDSLNNGAYLSRLQRDRIGEYHVKNAWNLDELVDALEVIQNKKKSDVS